MIPAAKEPPDPLEKLSPQERRIVALMADGASNKEIATALDLADQTVRNYMHTILAKLGLKNRVQLTVLAAKRSMNLYRSGRL